MPDRYLFRGLPRAAAYGPTKAALISLAESIHFDLAPKGIDVRVICPGFVETEATAVNDYEMPGIIIADIDPARVFEARGSVPSLTNARDYRPVDGVRPSVE